jgi:hypothetical protein
MQLAHIHGPSLILLVRDVFQVASPVIQRVSIHMVNLKPFRAWANEGISNQTMNRNNPRLVVF